MCITERINVASANTADCSNSFYMWITSCLDADGMWKLYLLYMLSGFGTEALFSVSVM